MSEHQPSEKVVGNDRRTRVVRCWANGKEYRVSFDRDGQIDLVEVYVWHRHGVYPRKVWSVFDGKPMTITAACAGRAALVRLHEGTAHA